MKNAYTRNGVTVSVDHVAGKKLPCLLLSFEGEPEIYKVAAFKDYPTACWFLEVMEEFFKTPPAPGGVPVVHLAYMNLLPTRWIPVTEALPDADGFTLIFTAHGHAGVCYFTNGWWGGYDKGGITHWMPLPEPPKEDPHAES